MSEKPPIFQYALVGFFILAAIVGLIFFSKYRGGQQEKLPQLAVWGTMSSQDFRNYISEIRKTFGVDIDVRYTEKDITTFYGEFIEAIAEKKSPDILLLPHTYVNQFQSKTVSIPFENIPVRTFIDTYLDTFQPLIGSDGIIGLPFTVDPLVMYWNKTLFTQAGLVQVPKTWEQVISIIPRLTTKNPRGEVFKSAVALGEWRNVDNNMSVYSALLQQTGNTVTKRTKDGLFVTLGDSKDGANTGAGTLDFFIQFSNPQAPVYTWNRSLLPSQTAFLGNTLAMYFGHASEIATIRRKNPQLNFDVSHLPQRSKGIPATAANALIFMIPEMSSNQVASYQVIKQLTSREGVKLLNDAKYLPSIYKADIVDVPSDPFKTVFNQSALISKIWIPVVPEVTDSAFQTMIESAISGKQTLSGAVSNAVETLSGIE